MGDTQPKITWKGYEFLDSIRDETIWQQVKSSISENVGATSVAIMITLAKEYAKQKLGLSQ